MRQNTKIIELLENDSEINFLKQFQEEWMPSFDAQSLTIRNYLIYVSNYRLILTNIKDKRVHAITHVFIMEKVLDFCKKSSKSVHYDIDIKNMEEILKYKFLEIPPTIKNTVRKYSTDM